MITEKDFIWHIKKANNIETNPKECEFCIINTLGDEGKIFVIKEQFPADERGLILSDIPEYYILFESSCMKTNKKESWNYGDYKIGSLHFIRVFKTLEEAKKRAFVQYSHIYNGLYESVFNEKPKGHYVVK